MAITRRVIFEVEDFFSLAPHFLCWKNFSGKFWKNSAYEPEKQLPSRFSQQTIHA